MQAIVEVELYMLCIMEDQLHIIIFIGGLLIENLILIHLKLQIMWFNLIHGTILPQLLIMKLENILDISTEKMEQLSINIPNQ